MSALRPITMTDDTSEGQVMINWTQVLEDAIKYDTNDEEETMRAKAKERKWHKAAEQALWEEQAWLEAKRVAREQAKAKKAERERAERIAQEAKEQRAEAGKGSEAGGEVKKVVMDCSCTCCAWAQVICKFVIDSNKKRMACVCCNLSKGKCCWPRDGKDTKAGPKAIGRLDKGKQRKIDKENTEAGPSKQKQVKTSARLTKVLDLDEPNTSRSRQREASTERYSGLEDKLECLINMVGLIANNLASLFKLHETMVENSGQITNTLKSLLNKSYGYGMLVTPPDLDSSEFNSDKLHEEAKWLKTHGKDKEEESRGEDETMAEAK
ncbi:hypothetical protein M404DRAFT_28702 [Pisolithus tinctorius Marx 270]|uniref:Uncharacterized protein n=1 Tax=Pisolithus tinctorius Marx 270 TaxID=870435 RepID=A0A0C3JVE5_PISTI|nr:hypothetical protein M404DRAFT_28702 [Pisolithus tinctorius Marx 270]